MKFTVHGPFFFGELSPDSYIHFRFILFFTLFELLLLNFFLQILELISMRNVRFDFLEFGTLKS